MRKLSAAAIAIATVVLASLFMFMIPSPARAQSTITLSLTSAQCFGGVWPVNCGVTAAVAGAPATDPSSTILGLKLIGTTIQSFCLGEFGCPTVDSLMLEGSLTQFRFPAAISLTFHQTNAALGPDGVYDDSYTGHITFNMAYTCHSSGGGRGSHNVVCTAQVVSIEDATITWAD